MVTSLRALIVCGCSRRATIRCFLCSWKPYWTLTVKPHITQYSLYYIFSAVCVFILSAGKKPDGSDLTDVSLRHFFNCMCYNAGTHFVQFQTKFRRGHQEIERPPLPPALFCCRRNNFFSLSPDIRQEHDENRLHLPGAGSAAARLSDVSLGELRGPRCSVSAAAERRTAACSRL